MDRRRGSRLFSALALASMMALLLIAAPPDSGTQIAGAAPAALDGPNIEGLGTFDVYYGLRKTPLEDGDLPAPFTAVRHEPFIGRWQTSSGMVQIWVEGAHTESRLLYFIAESAEGVRREFERSARTLDGRARLAGQGLPYRAP